MNIEMNVNNGDVQISNDVISSIVAIAVEEKDNFVLAQENFLSKMFQKNEKVIKVDSNENDEIAITVNVCIKYGVNIEEECKKLQSHIAENVEIMTSLNIAEVNLYVVSIIKETVEI